MRSLFRLSYTPLVRRTFTVPAPLFRFALRLGGLVLVCLVSVASPRSSRAQSSSSSSGTAPPAQESTSTRIAQPTPTGSAITLETSESLFDLAVALNTCGYDADLAASSPVRTTVRQQVAEAIAASPAAAKSRDNLCTYIRQHTLADSGLNIAQFVSLALYTSPDLTLTADITELPPDSTQIVTILPILHNFADDIHLHALWVERRPDYNALVDRIHDSLTRMILDTNVYLRSPASNYDDRRFLVLLEPMLAPSAVNARIYGTNYIIAVSPSASGTFHMEQIRHTYLHYEIEPMVYARASSMERLQPLLKTVAEAPIDFAHKSDIVSLVTECLIKAIEARTMDTGLTKPARPNSRERLDEQHYDAAVSSWERQTEAVRRNAANLATRHGWILTNYFYDQLIEQEHSGVSLKDNIGQMVYGMDVYRQRHTAEQISFLPEESHDFVRRVVPAPTGLRLAEVKLMQGENAAAEELANKALADPAADHAEAHYILARIDLLQRDPEEARSQFQAALTGARSPHTVAWAHIYLGRLYDVQPDRKRALQEYQAALAANDPQPDTRAAANSGLHSPFALPARQSSAPAEDDDAPLDPSGKAEKDSYQPTAAK